MIPNIEKIDRSLAEKTQKRLDNLTKPQGSLGRLEELAKQIVEITRRENPVLKNKVIFTMAGDHGVTEEGVSAFPKEERRPRRNRRRRKRLSQGGDSADGP